MNNDIDTDLMNAYDAQFEYDTESEPFDEDDAPTYCPCAFDMWCARCDADD